jgi:hypothetical protein
LLGKYSPDILALVAGAAPSLRPLQEHTWETFSRNWNTDPCSIRRRRSGSPREPHATSTDEGGLGNLTV